MNYFSASAIVLRIVRQEKATLMAGWQKHENFLIHVEMIAVSAVAIKF